MPEPVENVNDDYNVVEPVDEPVIPPANKPGEEPAKEGDGDNIPATEENSGDEGKGAVIGEQPPAGKGEEQEIDPELKARALEYGFTEEDMKKFGGNLDVTLTAMDRKMVEAGRQIESPSQELPVKKVEVPKETKPPEKQGPEVFDLGLDPDLVDPEVVEAFKKVTSRYEGVVAGLQSKLTETEEVIGELVADMKAERQIQIANWFDNQVEKLGPDWKDEFGEGSGEYLDREGKAWEARRELYASMEGLMSGYEKRGMKMPHRDELFKRALRATHGDKIEAGVRKGITSQLSARKSQIMARPTGRKTSDGTPKLTREQLAAQKVKEQFHDKRGIVVAEEDEQQF